MAQPTAVRAWQRFKVRFAKQGGREQALAEPLTATRGQTSQAVMAA